MINYTQQKQLGRFGARWGCFFTCIINIIETEMGRGMLKRELWRALGRMLIEEIPDPRGGMLPVVALCNYKDHAMFEPPYEGESPGWGSADKEYHFYIRDMGVFISCIKSTFGVEQLWHSYDIVEYSTRQGSHFVLRINGKEEINPDPNVKTLKVRTIRNIS